MRCRECDAPNPPERKTCSKCGAKLPPPPGQAAAAAEAPRAKPRPRPEPEEDDEEKDDRPRRRRRRAEEDYDDEDDEFDDEEESAVARVIPYHNKTALIGYYFAIFSLIPGVVFPVAMLANLVFPEEFQYLNYLLPAAGIALGGFGMILGIIGLVRARSDRRAKGGGHAATALFIGLLTFLVCAVGWILYGMGVLPMKVF